MGEHEAAEAEAARAWLEERGWDVSVAERDLREEYRRQGLGYADPANDRFWADLVRLGDPDHVVRNYGSGMTPEAAVIRARKRYGSEQA